MKKTAVPSILIAVMLLAVLALIAEAQQTLKVPRIGFLRPASTADDSAFNSEHSGRFA